MITLDLSILNQKGTPMFYSDIFANRPAFGIVGRIFISTDTAAIYRDTGSSWVLIADGGGVSTNIYNSDGTLTGNRDVSSGGFTLLFRPQTTFLTALVPTIGTSSYSVLGQNQLDYPSGFSSNNIGNVYSANGAINLQTFAGSATFAQANLASGVVSVNSIDFSSAGSTITMTQSSGIRAMTGNQVQIQYQGTNTGTITHAAVQQNLGFYRPSGASGTLTITNAYSHLINALDDYGAGFIFTNRWGIYQAGASDTNYFAGSLLVGTTVNSGFKVNVNGKIAANDNIRSSDGTISTILSFGTGVGSSGTLSNHDYIFIRNNFEAARFISDNSFGINCTPSGVGVTLNVYGGTSINSNLVLEGNNGNSFISLLSSATNGVGSSIFAKDGIRFALATSKDTTGYSEKMRIAPTTGNLLVGTTSDTGQKLYLNGSLRIDGQSSGTAGGSSGQHLIINLDGTTYKIALLNP